MRKKKYKAIVYGFTDNFFENQIHRVIIGDQTFDIPCEKFSNTRLKNLLNKPLPKIIDIKSLYKIKFLNDSANKGG